MSNKELLVVGHKGYGVTPLALMERMNEIGVDVTFVDEPRELNFIYKAPPMIEPLSMQTQHYAFSEYKPKPKHHNGKYNQVNRKKNKASKKARKQTRHKR